MKYTIFSIIIGILFLSCIDKKETISVESNVENYTVASFSSDVGPVFWISVNVISDEIINYQIKGFATQWQGSNFILADMKSKHDDITLFRDVLAKFIEWENIAIQNSTTRFSKQIPISISSKDIELYGGNITRQKINNQEITYDFYFNWNPWASNKSEYGSFDIMANRIRSKSPVTSFNFSRKNISSRSVRYAYEALSSENIEKSIQRSRERKIERQQQMELQDELFN